MNDRKHVGIWQDLYRINDSMAEQHARIEAIIERHLVAMYQDLVRELVDSIDPETEFGKILEGFIENDTESEMNGNDTKIDVEAKIRSFHCEGEVPAAFEGAVRSIVHLGGPIAGFFPLDIDLRVRSFHYKEAWIEETRNITRELFLFPEADVPCESGEFLEDIAFEANRSLGKIDSDLAKLEEEAREYRYWNDEDRFWEMADEIEYRLQETENLISLVFEEPEEVE